MAQEASNVLQQWLADEAKVREGVAAGAGLPPVSRAELASQPGLAVFDAMFAGRLPGAPIANTLDFIAIKVEPGLAIFQGQPLHRHYNPLGTVHGGWFATLLDSALGCAVHSRLPAGKGYTTLELKVNLVRALTVDVPRVRAEGKLIHFGGQTATAEARLVGPDGRLYAHATTTCLIFDARRP
ncbi:MAG TPA: PaaI family thioesterase [Lautropia sp.]|jgi:uncharacterized protein (TIGR00369 family)|nr:PaaI family thioesterase [Lautropia sp.]